MTPLNPPFEGGKFSPPPLEGELEGVNLDLLRLYPSGLWALVGVCDVGEDLRPHQHHLADLTGLIDPNRDRCIVGKLTVKIG